LVLSYGHVERKHNQENSEKFFRLPKNIIMHARMGCTELPSSACPTVVRLGSFFAGDNSLSLRQGPAHQDSPSLHWIPGMTSAR
jgi:hypothetical protein